MATPSFTSSPPNVKSAVITYPTSSVMLVRFNRPKDLNCINMDGHHELDALWKWYDDEPALSCAVVTGTGRAFCAGQDLKGKDMMPLARL
nr:1,2-epoxyphenylacetyl-coa isomerase [Quercus suber]